MPIAAKLFYFQRRRPPPPSREPADPLTRDAFTARRRLQAPRRPAHHEPGYKIARGSHREHGASSGSIPEPTNSRLFSSRLSTATSNDRLPDAVQQAKERLQERLQRVDLSLGRRQTRRAYRTVCAEPSFPSDVATCISEDGRLDSRITALSCNASVSSNQVRETVALSFESSGKDTAVVVEPYPEHVYKLWQEISSGTVEDDDVECLVDCSICLEGCHDADGVIQLRCKHVFHLACLERWLRARGDCPYCRASVAALS